MKDLNTGNLWLWERGKFMNRRYMMQEMYQQFLDEDDAWKKVAKDQVRKFAVSSVTIKFALKPMRGIKLF